MEDNRTFRVIKFTTDGDLVVRDIGPVEEEHLWRNLALEIGNGCELIERIPLVPMKDGVKLPEGYDAIGDESGWFHGEPKLNLIGSYLYGYPETGQAVVGDILIVKNQYTEDGETWVSMNMQEVDSILQWIKKNFDKMLLAVGFRSSMAKFNRTQQ